MKTLVVGGHIDGENSRASGVVRKLVGSMPRHVQSINGVPNALQTSTSGYDLILWMPDVPNEEPKDYPKKDKGSVLICSKVMREGYTRIDSVSRIFSMHANAVIEVHSEAHRNFRFKLVDALANEWCDTRSIDDLVISIIRFYEWSRGSVRIASRREDNIQWELPTVPLDVLSQVTQTVAQKVENANIRYFGNASTRCAALFPSTRMFVSARNLDKSTSQQMTLCR